MASDQHWRTWLTTFVVTLIATVAALFLALILTDPYGTGRFTPIRSTDTATTEPAFANVARVRDPRFNAAIVGNSRSMRLAPDHLNELTGLSFVNLAMPGLGPIEQIAVAHAFARHHAMPVVVMGLGDEWCRTHYDPLPFPEWLYGPSHSSYLVNLLTPTAIELGWRRLAILLGLSPNNGQAHDGYERNHPFWRKPPNMMLLAAISPPTEGEPVEAPMPYVRRLAEVVDELDARVVTLFLPAYANSIPAKDSDAHRRLSACKLAIENIHGAVFVDMHEITEETRNPHNFLDASHYTDHIARIVESRLASKLKE